MGGCDSTGRAAQVESLLMCHLIAFVGLELRYKSLALLNAKYTIPQQKSCFTTPAVFYAWNELVFTEDTLVKRVNCCR